MENLKIRRLWASLTLAGLIFTQFTTGVFPIPISPTGAAYAAGFSIEKERIDADEDEPVAPGDTIRYEITIRNNDDKEALARIIDPVPQYLEFVSGTNSCYYENQTDEVICAEQSLAIGASRSERITFRVKNNAPECTTIENQADVWNRDANYPTGIPPAWSNVVETPTVCDDPELDITKEVNETDVEPGDDLRYTLRVENVGTGTADNVVITDNIPSGLIYDDGRSDSDCNQVSNRIECAIGDLDEGDSDSVNIYFDVDPNLPPSSNLCGNNIINQASVTADNADTAVSNSVSTYLECPAPIIEVTKSADKTTIEPLDIITYEFVVRNTGNGDATNLTLTDPIDSSYMYLDGQSDSFCQQVGNAVECGEFDLDAGQSRTIEVAFKLLDTNPPCGSTIQNIGEVTGDDNIAVWSNQVNVNVECPEPDLDITKTGPSTVTAGNQITYQFTVQNTGNGVATEAHVYDFFIDNNTLAKITPPFDFDSSSGASCSYSSTHKWVECDLNDIDPGETKSFSITFDVPDDVPALCGTTVMNQADVHLNGTPNTTPASDWDKHQVNVTCVQSDTELEITKSANKNSAEHLEMVTYTLTVENVGNATAENVVVVDPVPNHTMFLDGQSDALCDLVGNNVVCDGFDLAPGEDRDFDLVFKVLDTAPCDGTISNRADAEADNAPTVWSNQVDVDVDCDDPSFAVEKRADKTVVSPGDRLTYEIEVENTGPITLEGLWIIDTVPTHLTYNDAASDSRCFLQGNDVKCGDDDITPGDTDTYTLVFDVNQNAQCGGRIENSAYLVFIGHTGVDGNTNTVRTDIECDDPDLELTKTANKQQAEKGDIVKYTLVLENNGDGTAYNAFVLDDVIDELTFIPLQSSPECDISGNTIECGPVDLVAGDSESFTIAFEVNHKAVCDSTIYNQAEAVADNHGSVLSNSESVDIVCDDPEADLKVLKSGPGQIMRGTTIVYEVTVVNMGPDTAENIEIRDLIPEVDKQDSNTRLDLVFNSSESDNSCYRSGDEVVCGGFDLSDGDSYTFDVAFDVPGNAYCAHTILNQVTVSSDTFDPISANNDDDHLSTVNCASGTLDIFKSGPATTHIGDLITYTITVENNLGFDVTRNRVIDPIPQHLQFMSADDNLCYYENQTDEVICGEFDLDDGDSRTFELTFKVLSSAPCNDDIVNVADIWSNHGGVNPQWSNAVKTKVLCDAELEIEKTDNQTTVAPGERYTYEIFISNVSQSDALDVVITDELPDEVSFVSANAGGNYDSARHEVEWTIDVDAGDVEVLTVTVDADGAVSGDVIYNEACIENGDCDDDTTKVVVDEEFGCIDIIKETYDRSGNELTPVTQFTFYLDGNAQTVQNSSNGRARFNNVPVGVHTVTEDLPSTWKQVSVTPSNGHVTVIESSSCSTVTFKNQQDFGDDDEDFTIDKTDNETTVRPGERLTYDITVRNVGNVDATDVEVTDELPSNVEFVSASDNGSESSGEVTWLIDLDAGESKTLTVRVDVEDNADDGDRILNEACVENFDCDDDTTTVVVDDDDDEDQDDDDDNGGEVTISVNDDPDPVDICHDDDLEYEIRLSNSSNANREVDVIALLDGDTDYRSSSDGGDERSGDRVEWDDVRVNRRDDRTLRLRVRVSSGTRDGDTLRLRVAVSDGDEDTEITRVRNRCDDDDDIIVDDDDGPVPSPELTIDKTADRTEALPGSLVSYTITIRNPGNGDIDNATLADDYPENYIVISDAGGASDNGGVLQWNLGRLRANSTTVVRYRARLKTGLPRGARVHNTATVRGDGMSRTDDHTIVVPTPPQTGLGGFIKSLTLSDSYTSESTLDTSSDSSEANAVVAVRPQARDSDTMIDAAPTALNREERIEAVANATAATVPAIVWTATMIAGLSMGGLFGRRFLI